MGWFSRKPAKEAAVVKMVKKARNPGRIAFGFLTLKKDGREVYFNQDHLDDANIKQLDEGQEVFVAHEPSVKRPGALQAVSISTT